MGVRTGMRVEHEGRRGTVLEIKADGAVRIAWDDGTISHRPADDVHMVGQTVRRWRRTRPGPSRPARSCAWCRTRVSTAEQAASGLGLEAQASQIESAAALQEWPIIARKVVPAAHVRRTLDPARAAPAADRQAVQPARAGSVRFGAGRVGRGPRVRGVVVERQPRPGRRRGSGSAGRHRKGCLLGVDETRARSVRWLASKTGWKRCDPWMTSFVDLDPSHPGRAVGFLRLRITNARSEGYNTNINSSSGPPAGSEARPTTSAVSCSPTRQPPRDRPSPNHRIHASTRRASLLMHA